MCPNKWRKLHNKMITKMHRTYNMFINVALLLERENGWLRNQKQIRQKIKVKWRWPLFVNSELLSKKIVC